MRDKGALKYTIMQGKVEGEMPKSRPRRGCEDDIKGWTRKNFTTAARRIEDRKRCKKGCAEMGALTAYKAMVMMMLNF